MTQSDRDNDPNLDDVKAVLRRLQNFALDERRPKEGRGLAELRRTAAPDPGSAPTLSLAPPDFPPLPTPTLTVDRASAPEPVGLPAMVGRRGPFVVIAAAAVLTASAAAGLVLSPIGAPLLRSMSPAGVESEIPVASATAQPVVEAVAAQTVTPADSQGDAAVTTTERPASVVPSGGSPISDGDPPAVPEQQIDRSSVGVAAIEAALRTAREALADGQVNVARATLLQMIDIDSADVAWTLARSYDPNVLSSLPSADAEPDPIEAEFWYRVWHARAVFHGLVPNSVSVDPLIRGLR